MMDLPVLNMARRGRLNAATQHRWAANDRPSTENTTSQFVRL